MPALAYIKALSRPIAAGEPENGIGYDAAGDMTRRARIRAFLLGLLIGGGSWTAAAHDDAPSREAPCDGVVADCSGDAVQDVAEDGVNPTKAEPDGASDVVVAPVRGASEPMPAVSDRICGHVQAGAFARTVDATSGPLMSGTPLLGRLSGSS